MKKTTKIKSNQINSLVDDDDDAGDSIIVRLNRMCDFNRDSLSSLALSLRV